MKTRSAIRQGQRARFDVVMHHANARIPHAQNLYALAPDINDRFMTLYRIGGCIEANCRAVSVARLEARLFHQEQLKESLETLLAFVVVWLRHEAEDDEEVVDAIWQERQRQRLLRLKSPTKYPFDMDHPLPDVRRKFRVDAEEIGEVAEAIDKLECASPRQRYRRQAHLETELIQVGAVTEAWLESYEVVA
jgi:hypothetical protein